MTSPIADEAVSPRVEIGGMTPEQLRRLNREVGWSFEEGDLRKIQQHFRTVGRDPSRVELEVLAQTWSEHCKHRVFHARVEHTTEGGTEIIDGIFDRFVRDVTEAARESNPGFVVSAFEDNAGFIRVDEKRAACLKVETHNHPSAIDPYAGANTGLGGVIRDVLGAGKGARPIASLDVFCVGDPQMPVSRLPEGVIHPRKVLRGVVRGVRDYGNRMGIPTVAGALCIHSRYTYNPLVYCGTAGVLPVEDVEKSIRPGQAILVAGGRTGRDGLHGATFSSASLSGDSHEEDHDSVQIGHPIEEKTLADFILEARREGLFSFITDCGAGGLSSAVGEMVRETGGEVRLRDVPLKEEGLSPWEIFLSESQERMVLAAPRGNVDELVGLAA